jgi:hypothetical protein
MTNEPAPADDTELALEPTTLDSSPTPPQPVEEPEPGALAEVIADSVSQLVDKANTLPSLLIQRDEIMESMHDAQREYSSAVRNATEIWSGKTNPLTKALTKVESEITSAEESKKKLKALADKAALANVKFQTSVKFIPGPTTEIEKGNS